MHKFAFCYGSAADPVGGALSPDGDLLAAFTGPTTKGTEEKGRKEKRGEKGKVKGKEGRRGERRDLAHPKNSAWRPLWAIGIISVTPARKDCFCLVRDIQVNYKTAYTLLHDDRQFLCETLLRHDIVRSCCL